MKVDSGEAAYVPSKLKMRDQYGRLTTPNSPEDFFYHLSPSLKTERKKFIKTAELKKAGRGQHVVANISHAPGRLQQFLAMVSLPVAPEISGPVGGLPHN
jgi:hypothetical protein